MKIKYLSKIFPRGVGNSDHFGMPTLKFVAKLFRSQDLSDIGGINIDYFARFVPFISKAHFVVFLSIFARLVPLKIFIFLL